MTCLWFMRLSLKLLDSQLWASTSNSWTVRANTILIRPEASQSWDYVWNSLKHFSSDFKSGIMQLLFRFLLSSSDNWDCFTCMKFFQRHFLVTPLPSGDFTGPAESSSFLLGSLVPIMASVEQDSHQPLLLLLEECIASTTPDLRPGSSLHEIIANKGFVRIVNLARLFDLLRFHCHLYAGTPSLAMQVSDGQHRDTLKIWGAAEFIWAPTVPSGVQVWPGSRGK